MDFMQTNINNGISNDDLYKLMDSLSIEESSALIAGVSPYQVTYEHYGHEDYVILKTNDSDPENANEVFAVCLKALTNSVMSKKLKASIEFKSNAQDIIEGDLIHDCKKTADIDTRKTLIDRDDLKDWLDKRGVYPSLLFPQGKKGDFMNIEHPNYSPKLALCVRAWEVAQTADLQGQTVKQFIVEWMKENAKYFRVENTGENIFTELATIPNWHTKGGRASNKPTPPKPQEY